MVDVGGFKLITESFQVSWLRDTMPIDQHNEQYSMDNRLTRHTLTIRRVKAQDFGNYSCVADNQLGKNKKIITLSGLPRAPQFRSNAQSQWRDKCEIRGFRLVAAAYLLSYLQTIFHGQSIRTLPSRNTNSITKC